MLAEIAESERWLSGYSTPGPSAEALRRTRSAVRRELLRAGGASHGSRMGAGWGMLATAACLALAAGIGWRSLKLSRDAGMTERALAAVEEPLRENLAQVGSMDEQLSTLEGLASRNPWESNGATMYETLSELLEDEATDPARGVNGASM
jgi:hypothetical protein